MIVDVSRLRATVAIDRVPTHACLWNWVSFFVFRCRSGDTLNLRRARCGLAVVSTMLPSTRPGGREYMPWPFFVHRLENPTWFGFWRSRRETLCPIQDHPSEGGILSSAACSVYFSPFVSRRTNTPELLFKPSRVNFTTSNQESWQQYVVVSKVRSSGEHCC